jgi:hypothetical protein
MRADNGRTTFRGKLRCDFSCNPAGLFIPGTEGTTDRIDYAPPHFVHGFARQIFETKGASVFGELMSERFRHKKIEAAM